jgi:hypothetical protein
LIEPRDPRRQLLGVVELVAAGAGLAVYAYAAGGLVEYLRFAGADLPAGQALALMSARQILIVGAIIMLLAIPVGVAMRLAVWVWTKVQKRLEQTVEGREAVGRLPSRRRRASRPPTQSASVAMGAFFSILATAVTALLSFAVRLDSNGASEAPTSFPLNAFATAAAAGGMLALALELGARVGRKSSWKLADISRLPRYWIAITVLLLALIGGTSFAYFAPLRLPSVLVSLSGGGCLKGLYLGRDGEGLHLVDGEKRSLLTLPRSDFTAVTIGTSGSVEDRTVEQSVCPKYLRSIAPPKGSETAGRSRTQRKGGA